MLKFFSEGSFTVTTRPNIRAVGIKISNIRVKPLKCPVRSSAKNISKIIKETIFVRKIDTVE